VLTAGARTRKAVGWQGLNLFLWSQGARDNFFGRGAARTAPFFTHDENLKKCMMGGGGGITFLYAERVISRR